MSNRDRNLAWKVCRVIDIHAARLSADLGANFLGLHAIEGVKERDHAMFRRIAKEMEDYYPKVYPLLVTKISESDALVYEIQMTGAKGVQLHAPMTRESIAQNSRYIRSKLGTRMIIVAVIAASDEKALERADEFSDLKDDVDFVIIDSHWEGGTGKVASVDRLGALASRLSSVPYLIAGGLNAKNVLEIVAAVEPDGVDVQSGLEAPWGRRPKDSTKLMEFARVIRSPNLLRRWRNPQRKLIGVSLTSVESSRLTSVVEKLASTDADVVHLDHSDGSLAPRLLCFPFEAARALRLAAPCMPYDLHMLVADSLEFGNAIGRYQEINPLVRVVFVHCESMVASSMERVTSQVEIVRQRNLEAGIAVHTPGIELEDARELAVKLRILGIRQVNFVLHSRARGDEILENYDLLLMRRIREYSDDKERIILGVDRDVDHRRLYLLTSAEVNYAATGRFVVESDDMQVQISSLRSLLVVA